MEADVAKVPVGRMRTLRNAVFAKRVAYEKRPGTEVLDTRILGTPYTGISGCQGLSERDDQRDLVMLTTDDRILSRRPTGWSEQGPWMNMSLALDALPARPRESWDPGFATFASDGAFSAWHDGRGGVFGQVLTSRGDALSRDFRIAGSSSRRPSVMAIGGSCLVLYTTGSALNSSVISTVDPGSPSVASTNQLVGTLSGSAVGIVDNEVGPWTYDAVPFDDTCVLVAANAPSSLKLGFLAATGFLCVSGTFPFRPNALTTGSSPPYAGPACAVSQDRLTVAYCWQQNPGDGISGTLYRAGDLSVFAQLRLDQDSAQLLSNPIHRMTAAFVSQSNGGYGLEVLTELSGAARLVLGSTTVGPTNRCVRRAFQAVDATGTLLPSQTTSGTLVRHSRLSSHPFSVPRAGGTGSDNLVWVTHDSPLQSTEFMVRTADGTVVGRSDSGRATTNVSGVLGQVVLSGTDSWLRPVSQRSVLQLPGSAGSTFGGRQLALSNATIRRPNTWHPVDIDSVLYMPGGWPGKYDGSNVTELGFALVTEGLSGSFNYGTNDGTRNIDAATNGVANSSSFSYAVIPEWTDAQGNRELGSTAAQLNATLFGTTGSVTLTWPTIVHTMRDGSNAPDIRFAVYRSGPNGSVLQRVDDPSTPILNSTGSDQVSYTDGVSELVRAFGEELYLLTERPNLMVTSPAFMTANGDRLWAAGLEGQPLGVAISKLRLGGAVAFNGDAGTSVDAAKGPITRLHGMDSSVIAFKRTGMQQVPLALNPTNAIDDTTDFPSAAPVVSNAGVPLQGTVIEVAGESTQGLMFWSDLLGARLIDRGLNNQNVGWPVAAFDDHTVVAGLSPRGSNAARLYTAQGETLSLDTRFNLWSTFPNQYAVSATSWNDRAVYAIADGRCFVETPDVYLDGGTPYSMVIETGWIPLADTIQGLGQVWEVFVRGNYYSPHVLRIELAYDYQDSYTQTVEFDTSASLVLNPYGTGPYGGQQMGLPASASLLDVTDPGVGPVANITLGYFATGTVGNGYPFDFYFDPAISAPGTPPRLLESATGTIVYIGDNINTELQVQQSIKSGSLNLRVLVPTPSGSNLLESDTPVQSYTLVGGTEQLGPDGQVYGSPDVGYQWRVRPNRPRCRALRIRISDRDGSGRSYDLTEIKLRCGVESRRPLLGTNRTR